MMSLIFAASAAAALINCVSQNAVALGATNSEPADTVIQAANGRCSKEWDRASAMLNVGSLGAARSGGVFDRMFQESRDLEARRLRDRVYSQAFQDLVAARSR